MLHFLFRWGNFPKTEAQTFGHNDVVEYLEQWEIAHEQKIKEEEAQMNSSKADESVPLPQ